MEHTSFTSKQWDKIQSIILNATLPKLQINRNTPRAMILGTKRLGGLGMISLEVKNMQQSIQGVIMNIRRTNRWTNLLKITLMKLIHECGLGPNILGKEMPSYMEQPTWAYSIWQYLQQINREITLRANMTTKVQRLGDEYIMTHHAKFTASEMKMVNMVRMYCRAIFLSDIINIDGKQSTKEKQTAKHGTRVH